MERIFNAADADVWLDGCGDRHNVYADRSHGSVFANIRRKPDKQIWSKKINALLTDCFLSLYVRGRIYDFTRMAVYDLWDYLRIQHVCYVHM